jgi:hypothetical protein
MAIAANGVPSHRLILPPALAVGVCPQLIVLVLVGFVPAHPPLPVTVNVAVKLPLVTVGVNTAKAGLAFCVYNFHPLWLLSWQSLPVVCHRIGLYWLRHSP